MIHQYFLAIALLHLSVNLFGKTLESTYEDPFDLGGGGAVLTRATQEGMLVSNPALLPYGGTLFRWLGSKTVMGTAKETTDLIRKAISGESLLPEGEDNEEVTNPLQGVLGVPMHFFFSQSFSFITNNGGFMVFSSMSPDLKIWEKGDPEQGSGIPMIVLKTESYNGFIGSLAFRSPFEWLSFGASAKYLLQNESISRFDLSGGTEQVSEGVGSAINPAAMKIGTGIDIGTLAFFQGRSVDFRFAYTIVDVGGTQLKGGGDLILPQVSNVGFGLTFHTVEDAFHLSADYRDINNVREQEIFKRVNLGAKVILTDLLGLSAGIYHGAPSYGLELDLYIMRLSFTQHTREYGDRPGIDSRRLQLISLSTGVTF